MNVQTEPADRQTGAVLFDVMEQMTQQVQLGGEVDIGAYVRQYPQYAEQLQKMALTLEVLRDLARPSAADAGPAGGPDVKQAPATGIPLALGTLGDYRILREIGRGGMGIVYEAEQISLSRKVALKVLPFAAMMDRRQLQRFQNEARAAASLRHPNIVQVHFVGCERAVHHYAMDYKHPARSFLSIKVALHGGRNGVGSRFRATIYHMGSGSPENDSRPLPPDSTKKYLAGCLSKAKRWRI